MNLYFDSLLVMTKFIQEMNIPVCFSIYCSTFSLMFSKWSSATVYKIIWINIMQGGLNKY